MSCAENAHRDFARADGGNIQPHRTGDAVKLLRRGELLPQELFANDAGLAPAADQAEEGEGKMNPLRKRQRIVLMAASDNEAERTWRRKED